MNTRVLGTVSAVAAALLIPIAALGQGAATATGQASRALATTAGTPKWMELAIDVDINRATVLDGIRAVLAAAKVSVEGVESEMELPPDARITVVANRVKVRDALAAVARLGGALAYVAETDGKVTIQLRKRTDTGTVVVPMPPNASGFVQSTTTIPGGPGFTFPTGAPALNVRVSVDRRDADLRDALRDVLKQAGVDFAVEADVPDDVRKSFTFDNVPLRDALTLMCLSAEVGWRVETGNGKALVRISKRFGRAPFGR